MFIYFGTLFFIPPPQDEQQEPHKGNFERVRTLASFDLLTSPCSSAPSVAQDWGLLGFDIYSGAPIFFKYFPAVQESPESRNSNQTHGKARVTQLTQAQKDEIANMASPSCMDASERKRQYAAMGRAIHRSCNPALLAKYSLCNDGERPGVFLIWWDYGLIPFGTA